MHSVIYGDYGEFNIYQARKHVGDRRRNTNSRVYELASQTAFPDQPHRQLKPFSQELDEKQTKLAARILRAGNSNPLRQVAYQPDSAEPIHIGKRRVGRPRQQWVLRSNVAIHNRISHTEYDGDPFQKRNVLRAARQRRV